MITFAARADRHILPRTLRLTILAAAILLAAAVGVTGTGVALERPLRGWNAMLRSRPASGMLHIVEIDARSIAAIAAWPWPRDEHARVVDRLRAAGASVIAFDVDFSARSSFGGDAALAAAVTRADGRVILPTFRQLAGGGDRAEIDALPVPALRKNAALAAVVVQPDADGAVRTMPMGIETADTPRPSLAAMLAGVAGRVGESFPIDVAIDPATLPRHSFIDIRDGRFDPAAVRGRQIMIGNTAIELGDRYPVDTHGVIPGVLIQALAAETLTRGVPLRIGWPLAFVVALAFAAAMVRARRAVTLATLAVAAPATAFALSVALQAMLGWTLEIVPALALAIGTAGGIAAAWMTTAWRNRRLRDGATGLGNDAAFAAVLRQKPAALVAVARIGDFEKLASGLAPDALAQLLLRVVDRIHLVEGGTEIFRVNERSLAWCAEGELDAAAERGQTLRTLMLSPVEVAGRRIDVSLSVGVAPATGASVEAIVAGAALAAEQAYTAQSGWHVHTDDEQAAVDRDLSLLAELVDAITAGDIIVQYQPKIDIASHRIVSVEALVRWQHPSRGLLRPDLFIPLAERNDRIATLTLHVIARTIADLSAWRAAGHELTAAVNLSAKLLSSAEFNADLLALLKDTGVRPDCLIFEVTESAAMVDPDAAVDALARLRAIGFAISMDDYGTGQSTLSYLKRLPLNEVKIDRSFVQFAHQNRSDAILVRSTIDLAHELGLKVVAEGVEDAACLAFLASVGCDMAQGYLISRPVDAHSIASIMLSEQLERTQANAVLPKQLRQL